MASRKGKGSARPKKTKHYRPPGKKREGNAARYVTRTQAIKHLQVSLPLFRKLCILKGVFPREPKKKFRGNNQTYYHVKDTAFLQHEPLLERFREIRSYKKKVQKAKAKWNEDLANRLLLRQPDYTLDRLIKERYPKFADALRDLDDCLTMVHLFAVLPPVDKLNIDVVRVHNCRRLSQEWMAYIALTHKLRKVFISVKGIYYQAEVDGIKVTWMTPHSLQQVLPDDVNFGIILTFLEFYETLLSFINFRLYNTLNLNYPPLLNPRLEALAGDLYSFLNPINGRTLASNDQGSLTQLIDDAHHLNEDNKDTKECKLLFKNMRFFFNREVPRESLLFVVTAFGGIASWDGDGAPFHEADQQITHQIVDRPTQGHKYLSREYIQPQWIYDCVNARIILPTNDYAFGKIPPPHLSPFVDNETEGYVPDYAQTIRSLQDAARNEVLPIAGGVGDLDDSQRLLAEGYISRTEALEAAERKRKLLALEEQYHKELKMEIEGIPSTSTTSTNPKATESQEKSEADLTQIADDAAKLSRLVLSRKQRGLYEAMEIGAKRKKANVDKLKERKRNLQSKKPE